MVEQFSYQWLSSGSLVVTKYANVVKIDENMKNGCLIYIYIYFFFFSEWFMLRYCPYCGVYSVEWLADE